MTTGTFSLEYIKLVGRHLISQQQTVRFRSMFISKSAGGKAGVLFHTEEERKRVSEVRDRDFMNERPTFIGLIRECP